MNSGEGSLSTYPRRAEARENCRPPDKELQAYFRFHLFLEKIIKKGLTEKMSIIATGNKKDLTHLFS